MNDLTEIVKSCEDAGLLIKSVNETDETGFIGMLAATLASSLLGCILSVKGVIQAGEGTNRAGQDFNATSSFN